MDVEKILKRLGVEVVSRDRQHLTARCPFHADREASWRIRLKGAKQGLNHCFSCKEGGDLLHLVKHLKGYGTDKGAREWLERQGEEVTVADLDAPRLVARFAPTSARAFALPEGVVSDRPLADWPSLPRRHVEGRGIPTEQAERWGLGYATVGRLEGRVVVPVRARGGRGGRLASYMARAFVPSEKRYLYPREAEGADMDVMFGEEHWPRGRELVVVTEGAFKSLAVERVVGTERGVAALGGSGARPMHVAKLATFRRVVVLTDVARDKAPEDDAGERAGDELQAALAGHAETTRVRLPPGEDADSLTPADLRGFLREAVWGRE
jgi:DNA primase